MQKLKNYTSSAPAANSIARIRKRLVDIGARTIIEEYDDQKRICGITFCIETKGMLINFKMPAQVDRVFQVLYRQVRRPNASTEERYWQQAERTAWKIISDWVDVQASMVMLEQADFLQVFMPYALLPTGKTMYQALQDSNLKLLM